MERILGLHKIQHNINFMKITKRVHTNLFTFYCQLLTMGTVLTEILSTDITEHCERHYTTLVYFCITKILT